MSRRWDALKPSSPTTATGSGSGGSNNNRRPPHHHHHHHHHHPSFSRQAWRPSRDGNDNVSSDRDRPRLFPDRQHQASQSKNDDSIQTSWNASLKTLQQQITGLKDGTISKDTKHLIIKTLEDLRSISDKLMTEQQRSDSIRFLLDLLPIISNNDIQNQLLDLVIQLLHAQSSLQMNDMDVTKYIKVLRHESRCKQGMICLAEFLRVTMDQLKPEDTATEVVGGIFLSLLEEHDNNHEDMVPTILKTLSILVQHSGHGSAILAPLTNVDAEGREQPLVNPLRQRLFRLLQAQLLHTSQTSSLADREQQRDETRVSACECLTHVLRVTRKLDGVGGAYSLMARRDVDMGILERFFLESLSGPSKLMVPSLSLLTALIQRYPESSSGVGAKLLSMPTTSHGTSVQEDNSRSSRRRCKVCSYASGDLPSLLKLIHNKDLVSSHQGDDASYSLSTLCVAEMLENMPFRKWFGTIITRSTTPRRGPAPVSGFGRRIIESLKCVINVSRCQFELGSYQPNISNNNSHHLSKLTITILNKLPYNDPTLLKEGTKLWATLASLVLELRLSDNKKLQFISTILVESCGGKVQPDGSLSTLCEPAKNFFTNKESSAPLIEHLSMNLSSGGPNGKASIQLLSALLRTRPQTAVEHWDHFSKGLNMLFNKQSYGIAIEVLEGLVLGRQDFGRLDEKAETTQRLAVVLDTALLGAQKESSARVKCLLLQTYGSLLSRDWDAFVSRGKDRFELHTDVILSHCIGDFNAKVRSTSCKALGNFCSSYLPTCENAKDICPVVSEHLQKALESTDHSVRCMVRHMLLYLTRYDVSKIF